MIRQHTWLLLAASIVLFVLTTVAFDYRLAHDKQEFAKSMGTTVDNVQVDGPPRLREIAMGLFLVSLAALFLGSAGRDVIKTVRLRRRRRSSTSSPS